jgi:large subunit ribosomal protein L33
MLYNTYAFIQIRIGELKKMAERVIITMACSVCKNRNYYFDRGKKQEGKLSLKKFCKNCQKRTEHKETK